MTSHHKLRQLMHVWRWVGRHSLQLGVNVRCADKALALSQVLAQEMLRYSRTHAGNRDTTTSGLTVHVLASVQEIQCVEVGKMLRGWCWDIISMRLQVQIYLFQHTNLYQHMNMCDGVHASLHDTCRVQSHSCEQVAVPWHTLAPPVALRVMGDVWTDEGLGAPCTYFHEARVTVNVKCMLDS